MPLKKCSKCKELKDIVCFSLNRGTKDGRFAFCKPCQSVVRKNHYEKNKDKELKKNQLYLEENYEKRRLYWKQYKVDNAAKVNANNSKRRAMRLQATPNWLNFEQENEILWFYEAAKALTELKGVAYEVDHIHPLRGKNFRGLHVPWNLQILTAEENNSKANNLIANDLALIDLA